MGGNKKTVRIIDREEHNKYNEEVVRIINEEYCDIQVEAEFLGDENGDGIKLFLPGSFRTVLGTEEFQKDGYEPGGSSRRAYPESEKGKVSLTEAGIRSR